MPKEMKDLRIPDGRDMRAQITHTLCDHCDRAEAVIHESGVHLCARCAMTLNERFVGSGGRQ